MQIVEPFQKQLADLADRIDSAFAESGIEDDMGQLRSDVRNAINELEVELPERPVAEMADNDDAYWLYDSTRDYMAQLAFYKERRSGANDEDEDDAEEATA